MKNLVFISLIVLFIIGIVMLTTSKGQTDFNKFENEGIEFAMDVYQERNITNYAVKGKFVKVSPDVYNMYLNGDLDSPLMKVSYKDLVRRKIVLSSNLQEFHLIFDDNYNFVILKQIIFENKEEGIKYFEFDHVQ